MPRRWEPRGSASLLVPCALIALAQSAKAEIEQSSLAAWNTMRTPESETLDWYTRHSRRRLLVSSQSCACVCAGTHEGYIQASSSSQCQASACVGAFPSCTYGEASARYSDGSLPSGDGSGTLTLQSTDPNNCQQAIIGATCSQQYGFSSNSGFIQLISTSSDACVPGSAVQSIAYRTRDTVAAGHFVGNINNSVFTMTQSRGVVTMDLNQGCILTYKVTAGGPLLGASSGGGRCFPGLSIVQTPDGPKQMSELNLGDKVQTVLGSGQLAFQPVFMFSHRDADTVSDFTTLETASGHRVMASPSHYLWVTRRQPDNKMPQEAALHLRPMLGVAESGCLLGEQCSPYQDAEILRAEEVQIGDLLWVQSDTLPVLLPSKVASTGRVTGKGLYNPHTASGSIVVDGVAALSFTDTLPKSRLAHALVTAPAKLLHIVLPASWGTWINARLLHVLGV